MSDNKQNGATQKERAARVQPAERRRQLTRCAVQVSGRCGLGNAGHAQVADEAGVSTPTVFLYMPNRQALINSVLAEVDDYFVNLVGTAAASATGASGKLLAVAQAFAAAIDSDPDHVKICLNWSTVVRAESWPQYVDFQDRILAMLETIIRDGLSRGEIAPEVNPVWGAHVVMGSAHMIAQMKFRNRDQREINEFLTALIRGALSGRV
ncbi:MAG TPA: TetR/AcrR family transcriptional regulator [Gammaproteobacteria bacterium]|nr:TetR/AcrR family transcriptional regulator [Gammaproteobacteria bacterium]